MRKTSTDSASKLTGPTMGTSWSVLIDDALHDGQAETLRARFQAAVDEVDFQMSTWTSGSDLMRLNAAPLNTWVPLPDRLMAVLAAGLSISHQTGGAFEMNVGDAVRAWGFGSHPIDLGAIRAASTRQRVPARDALDLDTAGRRARKSSEVSIDLSGIAKGYGVDRLAETAKDAGLGHALCVIDGEVRALGARTGGHGWAVGIDSPDPARPGHHSVLALNDLSVATSGDYRHFVTVGQTRLSHTMDPWRGAPLVDAPASVSVLSKSCMMADAMATALMVMGARRGHEFACRHAISALFLLRDDGGFRSVGTGTFDALG